MTDQTKPVLKMTEENKAALIAGIENGSAIVINVVSVAGGSAEFQVGSFLTGTVEQRENDLQHQALTVFTNALTQMIQEGMDGGLTGAAVTKTIRANPKLARILEPGLPEEMLKIFDTATKYEEAMEMLRESSLNVDCDCPECTKEREQKAEEAVNDAAEEAAETGSSIH